MQSSATNRLPIYAAWTAIIVGLSVLASWATGIEPFRGSFFTSIAMNPLTATLFILSGSSLWMRARVDMPLGSSVATILSLLVIALAATKLASFAGLDLAIDRMLFREKLDAQPFPNRMAPNTAINFLFIGLSLITLRMRTKRGHRPSDFLAILPILISLTGAMGYFYSTVALTQVGSFIPIAFNTTLAFLTICLGILFANSDDGIISVFRQKQGGAIIGKRLLPTTLFAPLLTGWVIVQAQIHGLLSPQFAISLLAVSGAVLGTAVLWFNAHVVNKLEAALEKQAAEEAERKISRLKRFFPPSIANQIASGEIDDPFKWHRNDVTVIFLDIRGFTSYAEFAEPEDVMNTLQEYYAAVAKVTQKYGGTIGHLAGDGMMIFFNDPVPVHEPQKSAVLMALEIRTELNRLCAKWKRRDLNLNFGAGLASGYTTIGGIGSEGFWDYTVIGTTTNVASRLCSAAKEGQILVSKTFLSSIANDVEAESIGSLNLKGLHQPVTAFNVVSARA